MKNSFLIIFTCISFNAFAKQGKWWINKLSPPDTTVISQILALSLNSYIGKPVDSLFAVLPLHHTYRGFMPERIAYNRGVFQAYGNESENTITVEVYIDNYQYMTFPDRARTNRWDMNLAKKETISFIKVIKNNTICVYGCNNPNYDY